MTNPKSPTLDPEPATATPEAASRPSGPAGEQAAPSLFVRLGLKSRAALSVLSGLLYFLAFPGVDLWPLSFVALTPLIVALRGQTPRRAMLFGWLAGFTMTMCGFYWLLEMLETFSGFPLPLCLLFMALLCAYQAGRIAFLGWLFARAEARGWPAILVFLLAFAASEQAFPLLFPWHYAATIHQLPVLFQLAEFGGPILVALILVCPNLALAELALARLQARPLPYRGALWLLLPPLLAAGYGALRIRAVDQQAQAAPRARVGIVQANMSLLGKRRDKAEGLRRHLELTRELQTQAPLDLVVWSETSVMRAVREDELERVLPRTFTRKLKVPAVFGSVLARPVDDARGYVLFNSALASDASGRIVGRYDKQFLLAFGEYLPFGETFPKLHAWSPNSGRFTPGKRFEPLKIGEHELATFICYEDISPSFVNKIMHHGNADLLVNLTNDAWFGDTTEPWIHLALSKLRAVEQRRYFVRSTNSGVSAFIDPVGRTLKTSQPFEQQALAETIGWMRGKTVYYWLGDAPMWLLTLLSVACAFVARPRAGWPGSAGANRRRIPDPDARPTS